jgi:hypothetical protein
MAALSGSHRERVKRFHEGVEQLLNDHIEQRRSILINEENLQRKLMPAYICRTMTGEGTPRPYIRALAPFWWTPDNNPTHREEMARFSIDS